MFSLAEIADIVGGEVVGDGSLVPCGFAVDSRRVGPGDLFFALAGARADGHAFVGDAVRRGACGVVVTDCGAVSPGTAVVVADVQRALADVASAWRARFRIPVVAITGSNGKTTTKALLAHLAAGDYEVHVAPENYNTEIGIPLAILAMPSTAELGVFELGADRPGDIAPLVRLLRPSAGILTSVGPSHLEAFGTTERVAAEKWDLVRHLPPAAPAYVNADSPELAALVEAERRPNVVAAGIRCGDVRARVLSAVPTLSIELESPALRLDTTLVGEANATNLLLAALCTQRLGVPPQTLAERAATFRAVPHRMERRAARFGIVLDDVYNANPGSVAFALRTLALFRNASRRVAVLGDMLGLGEASASLHREIARLALALDLEIDAVYPVGERQSDAFSAVTDPRVHRVSRDGIAADVATYLVGDRDAVVLVKGSHDMRLEGVVDDLLRLAPADATKDCRGQDRSSA